MRTAMAQGARKAMAAVFGQRVADASIAALRAGVKADAMATTEAALTDTVDAKPPTVCYLTTEEYAAYFDRIHAAEGDR